MNLKSAINKFSGHLKTVSSHRRMVFYHARKVGIPVQGLLHDLSKYSPSEFLVGVRYFVGNKSPNEGERLEYGYSKAWLHHKGRNRHHFEYWTDYSPVHKKVMPVKMPLKYCLEMFCDRVAASKIYQKENYNDSHPIEYFLRGKDRRFIHQETSDLLEGWLLSLSEKGEEETLKYLRKLYKSFKKGEITDY